MSLFYSIFYSYIYKYIYFFYYYYIFNIYSKNVLVRLRMALCFRTLDFLFIFFV